ncbi:MAG: PAS domain S-box protein [Parvibaculum sp.]|nr:PAS domain S-box protein [Parvibaculum sp.]
MSVIGSLGRVLGGEAQDRSLRVSPGRIAAIYAALGCLWIVGSDAFIGLYVDQTVSAQTQFQTLKGLFFVLTTTLVLYGLLRLFYNRLIDAEARLDAKSETLRVGGQVARLGGWTMELPSRHIVWSDEICTILGLPAGSVLQLEEGLSHYVGESAVRVSAALEACIGVGQDFDDEFEFRTKDGTLLNVRVAGQARYDDDGNMVRIDGALQDITELRRTEMSLAESRKHFRELADAMPLIVWTANPDGLVDFTSRAFSTYSGLPGGDTPGQHWIEAIHPEDMDDAVAAWMSVASAGGPYSAEFRLRRHDGAYHWHIVNAVPVRDADGTIVKWYGAATDIDDRKRTEQQLSALATRLTTTLESITDAFYTLDTEWRFTYMNPEAERLLLRSREDLIGKSVWEEYPEAAQGTFYEQFVESMASQTKTTFEDFYPPLDKWFFVTAYPSREGLAVYFQDVSEKRQMEARLRQTQRLESVGQLTGGVAHDFNNLLTVILGNSDMLAESLSDNERLRSLAVMTRAAAERGADLTGRLLAFSRQQALEPKSVDVLRLLSGVDGLLRRSLGEHIEIETVSTGGLWPALVDPAQLESAVLNLAINARDAMPDGGRLTIELANVHLDQSYAGRNNEVTAGQYVMVAVSDSGTGMTPEIVARAFEPFFTTKETGKGSGLGLSMVYGFIKQSGGHVQIYSELGQGTTIKLYLPRANADDETALPRARTVDIPGGAESILLVEDDQHVREYVLEQLQLLGYRVIVANDGPQALDALRQITDIDLLFTDVVMPGGMNGRQLADAAKALRPGLKVLFTSGYTENAIVHHGRLDRGVHLLSKPYRRQELAMKIRKVLDGKASGKD